MNGGLPRAWGEPDSTASIRCYPEDFEVREELGFEPEGDGEHAYLHLRKTGLNTMDLARRISELSGAPLRDIGFSGLKDRHAVTSQWFSVGLAGRPEPDWQRLQNMAPVEVLAVARHRRKLRRGVHRRNRFILLLRDLRAERQDLEQRLERVSEHGVPNYFGEQRFGRGGENLAAARRWAGVCGRVGRTRRSLYLSTLRSEIFNTLLADRVNLGLWEEIQAGDICMLAGSRTVFPCAEVTDEIRQRVESQDLHPALPLWGRGALLSSPTRQAHWRQVLAALSVEAEFLERQGPEIAWRSCRLVPDDFFWEFCEDDALRLDFHLAAGSFATAVLAELVQYREGYRESEQDGE